MNKKILLDWYQQNARDLPWRKTRNPYKIWLSEIILQQTRVRQGLPYYYKFLQNFPDIFSLAKADEEKIMNLWQGLGYYSRARNMHFTAKDIVQNYQGIFPKTKKELIKLKGIGDYTASAIASFAYDEPVGVVDGNVNRFFSRYFGVEIPVNSHQGKKYFTQLADKLIDKKQPGIFNQALMEFGALHCKPTKPLCKNCPFQSKCVAFKIGNIEKFPIKNKKTPIKTRFLNYFLIRKNHQILIEKRIQNDIWKGLYQLPLIETNQLIKQPGIDFYKKLLDIYKISADDIIFLEEHTHRLTHQKLIIRFWKINIKSENAKFTDIKQLKNKGFPIIISKFLDNNI